MLLRLTVMMRRLSIPLAVIAAAACLCLPGGAAGAAACPDVPRPAVEIRTEEMPARFDTSRTKEELARMRIDTASPWPAHYATEVGGLMEGRILMDHKVRYSERFDPGGGAGCVWLTKVEIVLKVDPKVYIASDVKDQACWFREIFGHEAQHVAADRAFIEGQAGFITEGLNMLFAEPADYVSGPVPAGRTEAAARAMGETVREALWVLYSAMMERRGAQHQEIDSLDEYMRISGKC